MSQKIRIKLKSYDYNLVDKSAEKIVKTVKSTGAIISGPIPLPTHKRARVGPFSAVVSSMKQYPPSCPCCSTIGDDGSDD